MEWNLGANPMEEYTKARQVFKEGLRLGERWGALSQWDLTKVNPKCSKKGCYGRGILYRDVTNKMLVLCTCVPRRPEEKMVGEVEASQALLTDNVAGEDTTSIMKALEPSEPPLPETQKGEKSEGSGTKIDD